MNQQDSPSRQSRKGLYFFILLPCVLMLLICGGPIAWWLSRNVIAARELKRQTAELIARDIPIDDASITVYREQQMSKQQTARWMEILATLESKEFGATTQGLPIIGTPKNQQSYVPGEPWVHADEVTEFLDQWSDLRTEMHAVLEESGPIWTPIEFESFNTMLPSIQSSRTASRLLTLEFRDAMIRGDQAATMRSLLAMIGVSRSMEKEPSVISQLVHIATLGVALRDLKLALEADFFEPSQLLPILSQLQQRESLRNRHRYAILGERALALPAFDNPGMLSEGATGPSFGARPIDALASLQVYEQLEAAPTDTLDQYAAFLEQFANDYAAKRTQAGPLRRFDTIITDLVTPAMDGVGLAMVRSEMEVRIAKLAIGVRLYQDRFGRSPTSVAALNELDVDLGELQPLGTKPFGLRNEQGTVVLWGFDPQAADTQTPAEPINLEALNEGDRSREEYWLWQLKSK